MKFPFRIRLLPIFLGIILLMISVRIGDVWLGISSDAPRESKSFTAADLALAVSGKALAQENPDEESTESEIPTLDGGPESLEGLPEPDSKIAGSNDATPEGMAPANVMDDDDMFSSNDFGDMSPGEIRLLHDLVARREGIDKRERLVKEREALLRSAEQQLLEKQKQLVEIKQSIDNLLKVYKQEQSQEAKRLVKIYTNMKAKSAARIFNEMDMGTLIQVFRGMKERSIAPIMAAMDAEKARLVTRELAEVDGLDEAEALFQ